MIRSLHLKGTVTTLVLLVLTLACRKEDQECPTIPTPPVDGRDQFVGQYQVFDTNGTFLYSMEIMKANDPGNDSLFVVNWGGLFDFYVRHENGDQSPFLNYIPPFPSLDHNGHRWAFFQEDDTAFIANRLVNDTLRMSYLIDNIAFFFDDGVPYFSSSFREYGVKQ